MYFENEINLADLPQSQSYELIPAGWYTASVREAEVKMTKDGKGQYLKLQYEVVGPTHAGRKVFGNLNIRNQSQKAEEIGLEQLAQLMRAIGVSKLKDTDQLIGALLQIKISIRDAQGGYDAQNEVRGFKSVNGSAPAPVAATAPAQAPSKSAPPWAKR